MSSAASIRWTRAAVFVACSLPLLVLGSDALRGHLGANPIENVMNRLGFWALFWLMASLAATPLKILLGWTWPIRFRRMVGLFAFTYVCLHFTTYFVLDQFFDFPAIYADIVKRKFITIGMLGFVLLIPLAITSTDRWVRRLGFVKWKRIHRLVYAAAVCGVIHFVWRVKADLLQPLIFAGILATLFLIRIVAARGRKARSRETLRLDPKASEPQRNG